MNTQTAGLVFGAVFLVVGILGYLPNPLISEDGLFAVNSAHNMVHVITGAIFVSGALYCADKGDLVFKAIGASYVIVTVAGFLTSGTMLLGLVHINEADRWLHLGLAVVILATGFALPNRQRLVA